MTVQQLKAATVASVRAQLVLLGVLVAVVLLIATTNVVNLFLLRADKLRALPGVSSVGVAMRLPLSNRGPAFNTQ